MKSRKRYYEICLSLVLGIFMWSITSCNKDFKNVLPEVGVNDTLKVGDGSRRVLYIIMDGVKGSVLKEVEAANIREIVNRSIYTYDGIADFQRNVMTQASAWTTMMTGVDYTKNHVVSDDFLGFDNEATPTVFTRIKDELGNIRTTSFSSSSSFNGKLAVDASVKQTLADDIAVKGATLMELTKEDPYLLVCQFNGAEKAASGDYSTNNASYVKAINTIDSYIGEILEGLRSRKTFSGENWLVVISSSKGGGPSGGTPGSNIFEDGSRNTFVAYYNPKFKSVQYNKPDVNALPYTGSAPRFLSNNSNINGIANQTNTSIGNFGTSGNFTLMFKIRDDNSGVQNYPMFVGKRNPANTDVGANGWSFLMGGGSFQVDWGGTPRPGGVISTKDGKWHTMGFTIYTEGGTRKLSLFSDGVLRSTNNISSNTDNNFPLRIGTDSRFNTNILIKDFVILNVALSQSEMIANMRKEFGLTNPYFNNTVGWWPGNESSGNRMVDMSGKGNDFVFSPTIQFAGHNDISPNISPSISPAAFKSVPNGVDIPVMIYNWMNISVPKKWELMGRFYNPTITLPNQ